MRYHTLSGGWNMNIRYDLDKLKKIIDDLHRVTGISMALMDTKYNFLYNVTNDTDTVCQRIQASPEGDARCSCSDQALVKRCAEERGPVSHVCHAGLLDTAVPIFKGENIAGFLVIGRIRTEDTPKTEDYQAMVFFSDGQLHSLIDLVSHILFESAIEIDCGDDISRATDYIDTHLAEELTLPRLCAALHVSRNSLYKSFHSTFDCTVNEYITERRLRRASVLLRESGESVTRIAEAVGIPNYTYFSRLFKKKTGLSPLKYRKLE